MRVHSTDLLPSVCGLCTGYEKTKWRNDALASYLFEYLPEFALRHDELGPVPPDLWMPRLLDAARLVYTTKKFKRRGEFGELILHAVLRELYDAEPAVSKIYYKDSPNDTIKGFDAVHLICPPQGDLELLLGEVKFFKSISSAMTKVAAELRAHFEDESWLKDEFAAVTRKVDASWPRADEFRDLLHRRRSLDEIASRIRVPVLLTYESECAAAHKACDQACIEAFEAEILGLQEQFGKKNLPKDVVVDLLLVPMHEKRTLLKALDKRLRALQELG